MTNQPNGLFVQADQAEVDYVQRPFEERRQAAERIAADKSRTQDWQQAEIRKTLEPAASEVQARAKETIEALQKRLPELKQQARLSFTPPAEQVAQLNYVRQVLEIRAPNMSFGQFINMGREALDSGDLVLAKVIRDFGEPLVRKALDHKDNNTPLPGQYLELLARIDDALSTPEQREARTKLAQAEATIRTVQNISANIMTRVGNFRLNGNQLVDGLAVPTFRF